MTLSPTEIKLLKNKKALVVAFADHSYQFSAELLRVESPSAEVRGHGPDEKKIIAGKKNVTITAIEPKGNYAIGLTFSDGHKTGIYSWEFFRSLGQNQQEVWAAYLDNLAEKNLSRT